MNSDQTTPRSGQTPVGSGQTAAPFEVVRVVGIGDSNPLVHVGRPVLIPGDRFGARRALWLVVSARGQWLACGTVRVLRGRMSSERVEWPASMRDGVPPDALVEVELAICRAVDRWREVLSNEDRLADGLANARSQLIAAEARRAAAEADVAAAISRVEQFASALPGACDPIEVMR